MGSARSQVFLLRPLACIVLALASPSALAQPSEPAPASTSAYTSPSTPVHSDSASSIHPPVPRASAATPAAPALVPPVTPVPAPSPPADPRRDDAHLDRVILLPTAETHPAHSTVLSNYDIAVLQLTYAVTERTQLAVTLTPPLEGFFPIDVSLKSQIARGPFYRLAALGSVSGVVGLEDGPAWLGRVGVVGQACLDARCRSSINLGTTAILAGPASFFASGAGVILRLSNLVALVAEIDTLAPGGRTVAEWHGIVAGAGVRWSGSRWAVDAALYRSLEATPSVVPVIAGTFRFFDD